MIFIGKIAGFWRAFEANYFGSPAKRIIKEPVY